MESLPTTPGCLRPRSQAVDAGQLWRKGMWIYSRLGQFLFGIIFGMSSYFWYGGLFVFPRFSVRERERGMGIFDAPHALTGVIKDDQLDWSFAFIFFTKFKCSLYLSISSAVWKCGWVACLEDSIDNMEFVRNKSCWVFYCLFVVMSFRFFTVWCSVLFDRFFSLRYF